LASDDPRARQNTLTGGEGAGVATVANVGIKAAFGRLRAFSSSCTREVAPFGP